MIAFVLVITHSSSITSYQCTFLLHVAVINKLCMQMDNPVSLNLYILQVIVNTPQAGLYGV